MLHAPKHTMPASAPITTQSALDVAMQSKPRGASKTALLATLTSCWKPLAGSSDILDVLTSCSLKHLEGNKLRNRIYDGMMRNLADGLDYAVVYHHCYPRQCFEAKLVQLSFRASTLGNWVLVRPLIDASAASVSTRSHLHENMSQECIAKTAIAKQRFWATTKE